MQRSGWETDGAGGTGGGCPALSAHLGCGESVMLHEVAANEGAGTAEASLAVDGEGAALRLGDGEELREDGVRWARAVREVQVMVTQAGLCEQSPVVLLHVTPRCQPQACCMPIQKGSPFRQKKPRALEHAGRREVATCLSAD